MAVQKTNFTFPSASKAGVTLNCFRYLDDAKDPVGVVMITHGLSENIKMFEDQAVFLAEHGYICAGMDFLGHGTTNGPGCVGIAPDDTNEAIWKDMFTLYHLLKDEYPDLPLFSFSHSMGSMMVRTFLAMYGPELDIKACFFTGDSHLPSFLHKLVPAANLLGRIISRYPKDLEKRRATFELTDYGQNPPLLRRLPLFWLAFDRQDITNYISNPYSGGANADFKHVIGFVLKALSCFAYADRPGWAEKIPDDIVLHHGCGQWDIPGLLGLGPKLIHRDLLAAGKKTELHLYFRAMHEVHAEMGIREEFHRDLLTLFNDNNPLL